MGATSSTLEPETLADLKEQTEFTERELRDWYKGFQAEYPAGFLSAKGHKFKVIIC